MVNLIPVLISAAFYASAALGIKLFVHPPADINKKDQKNYLGQHLSILHAYLAIFGTSSIYILEGGIDYNSTTNYYHGLVLMNSIGYFLFDSIYGEIYHIHDNIFRFHHIFGLSCLFTMLYSPIGGSASMFGIFISEISNPCILKRNILGAENSQNSTLYSLYENTFVFLFIVVRIIFGFWYLLGVWNSQINWLYACMASSIYTISWFWVFIIILKLSKKIDPTSDPIRMALISALRFLKPRKGLLLMIFLMFGYGVPYLLTQVLKVEIAKLEIAGFNVI